MSINHRKLPRIKRIQPLVSLDNLIEKFIISKESKGVRENTIERYIYSFNVFKIFITKYDLPRTIEVISEENLTDFIIYMLKDHVRNENNRFRPKSSKQEIGLSPTTADDIRGVLNNFINYLIDNGYGNELKFAKVGKVKHVLNDIIILTEAELSNLIKVIDKTNYPDFRNYVLITFLIDTMCRINEALSAEQSNIDINSGFFNISAKMAKNGLPRVIPLQKRTVHLLKELYKYSEQFGQEYVFLTDYGTPLNAEHFRKQIKRYAKKAKITKRIYPHLFRHTSATMFLENGGDMRHLQMILGHKDLRMVERYTHLTSRGIADNIRQYTPINRLRF